MTKKSSSKTTKAGLQNPNVASWDMSKKISSKPKPMLQKPTLKNEKPSSTPTRYGQEIDDIFCKKRKKPEQQKTSKLTKKPSKDSKDDESLTRKRKKSKSRGSNVNTFESEEVVRPRRKTGDGLATLKRSWGLVRRTREVLVYVLLIVNVVFDLMLKLNVLC